MGLKKTICAVLLACMMVMLWGFQPLVRTGGEAQAGVVTDVLEWIGNGFTIYDIIKQGGEVGWAHSGITPDDKLLETVKEQGALIDAVQDGLNKIQKDLAHMYEQLNLQDAMENAWAQIPNILTYYDQLNSEIADVDIEDDIKERVEQWAYNVVDLDPAHSYFGMEDSINQFWFALCQTGTGANEVPVLEQMLNFALQELKANGPQGDFSATVESTNGVPIVTERPMYFNYNRLWDGGHCQAGQTEPGTEFYFAEGTTRPDFVSYLCIQNPGEDEAQVKVTYMRGDGTTAHQSLVVPKHSRATVNAGDTLGRVDSLSSDFSAKVESINDVPIVAERPVYFNYNGFWQGGHCAAGIKAPSERRFFAEGTTRPNFETYLCIQNPEETDADVRITYMKGDGTSTEQVLQVPRYSRKTVRAADILGQVDSESCDFSAKIESTNGVNIVAERPMYFNFQSAWLGGHCGNGVVDPSTDFYFAEGTTRPDFHTFISILNPENSSADVKITYMKGDGTSAEQTVAVPAHTRATVRASDLLGSADSTSSDFSTRVQSMNGANIVAERPVYFNYDGRWDGGHCQTGLTSPAGKYYFAEGTVREGFEPYFCIQNPSERDADVKIIYMKGDGTTQEQQLTVPKQSRRTVRVGDDYQGTTLVGVYNKYLESFFMQCVGYQTMAMVAQCNALDYLYHDDPDHDSSNWMEKYFIPKMEEETDMFVKCVDQLVMSQAQLSGDWGQATSLEIPGAYEVLSRADLVRRLATGKIQTPDADDTELDIGMYGRIIATQDLVPKDEVPAITAGESGGGYRACHEPSSGENPGIEWISTDGKPLMYDMWVPDQTENYDYQFSLNGEWSSAEYAFDALGEGTYDILENGDVLATESVDATTIKNPLDPSKNLDVYYGYFLSTQRHSLLNDLSLWTTKYSYTDGPNGDPLSAGTVVRDNQKGELGSWAWADKGSTDVEYQNHLISANFSTPQDIKGVVFHYDVGTELCAEGSGDTDSLSTYPNGFVYVHRGYTWDSATASAGFNLVVHDLGPDQAYSVCSAPLNVNLPANADIATYTRRQGYGPDYKCVGSKSIDFTAGHIYNINFQVVCTINTKSAQGQVNMKGVLRSLGASNM